MGYPGVFQSLHDRFALRMLEQIEGCRVGAQQRPRATLRFSSTEHASVARPSTGAGSTSCEGERRRARKTTFPKPMGHQTFLLYREHRGQRPERGPHSRDRTAIAARSPSPWPFFFFDELPPPDLLPELQSLGWRSRFRDCSRTKGGHAGQSA